MGRVRDDVEAAETREEVADTGLVIYTYTRLIFYLDSVGKCNRCADLDYFKYLANRALNLPSIKSPTADGKCPIRCKVRSVGLKRPGPRDAKPYNCHRNGVTTNSQLCVSSRAAVIREGSKCGPGDADIIAYRRPAPSPQAARQPKKARLGEIGMPTGQLGILSQRLSKRDALQLFVLHCALHCSKAAA